MERLYLGILPLKSLCHDVVYKMFIYTNQSGWVISMTECDDLLFFSLSGLQPMQVYHPEHAGTLKSDVV